MKSKSSKILKLEKNRKSILTNNLDVCIFCGMPKDHLHEVYFGKNMQLSMDYGCVVPLCFNHHHLVHNNHTLDNKLKQKMQESFEKTYPTLDFIAIFGRNYKE